MSEVRPVELTDYEVACYYCMWTGRVSQALPTTFAIDRTDAQKLLQPEHTLRDCPACRNPTLRKKD